MDVDEIRRDRGEGAATSAPEVDRRSNRRGGTGRERIYIVEPTGPFEDDPNVTNKRYPGNVTQSYRTRHPMRIVGEIDSWEGHPAEAVQGMLDNIAKLRADGLDVIED